MAEIVGTELNDVLEGTDGDDVIRGEAPLQDELRLVVPVSSSQEPYYQMSPDAVSSDGRYLVYTLSTDTGNVIYPYTEVFVSDLVTGAVTMLGTGSAFAISNDGAMVITKDGILINVATGERSYLDGEGLTTYAVARFSEDGSKVVFQSESATLAGGSTDGLKHIYVRDLASGEIVRVSTAPDGTDLDFATFGPRFAANGTKVIFKTGYDYPSVSGVMGSTYFVKDLENGSLDEIDLSCGGRFEAGAFDRASFSADGTKVVFPAREHGDDTYKAVWLDLETGQTVRLTDIAVMYFGSSAVRSGSFYVQISEDGQRAMFNVSSSVTAYSGNFVYDIETGHLTRFSENMDGQYADTNLYYPLADGDLQNVFFTSRATNLIDGVNTGGGDPYMYWRSVNDGQSSTSNDLLAGGDGNDTLDGGAGDDILYGEQGDDTLLGGEGDDQLFGFVGNDSLDGGAGADILMGEAGDDLLIGGAGDDDIDGGDGFDTVDYSDATEGVSVTLKELQPGNGGNELSVGNDTLSNIERVIGSAFGDTLVSALSGSVIEAGQGNDTVSVYVGGLSVDAGSGDDTIIAQLSQDDRVVSINAGDGADKIEFYFGTGDVDAGAGDDEVTGTGRGTFRGGDGNDHLYMSGWVELYGDGGNDIVRGFGLMDGGDGDDMVIGFGNKANYEPGYGNTLIGGAGNDYMVGVGWVDLMSGGADNDLMFAGENDDVADGGDGDDIIAGEGDNDIIRGAAGNDRLYGDFADGIAERWEPTDTSGVAGNDELYGGDGNDQIWGEAGNDTLDGEAGNDTLDGGAGQDWLYGGHGEDMLDGGDDTDALFGGEGADILKGGAGGDSLDGGAGNDDLYGQGGIDWMYGGDGNDLMDGGADTDAMFGEAGDDTMWGGDGGDSLDGGAGLDVLYGGAGVDWLFGGDDMDHLYGNEDDDVLFGDGGDDLLSGGEGGDALDGGDGADRLRGDGGSDTLYGGEGDDLLEGGEGIDILTGGAGADIFRFDFAAELGDLIRDFETGVDRLELGALELGYDHGQPLSFQFSSGAGLMADFGVEGAQFYFETETRSLWFDVDGGSTANIMHIAGFETGVIEAGDIFLS